MTTTVKIRFRVAYYTAATWTSENPVLLAGELGYESGPEPRKHKIGDGTTAWNSLSYAGAALTTSLTAIGALTPAADRLPYFTGATTAALATFTAFARTLVEAVSAAAARTALGLGLLATKSNVNDADWSGADLTIANGGTGSSTAPAARTALGLGTVASTASGASVTTTAGIIGLGVNSDAPTIVTLITLNGVFTDAGNVGISTAPASGSLVVQALGQLFFKSGGTTRVLVRTNGIINFAAASHPTYATDASAGTAGLVTGDVYQSSDGAGGFFLKIKA